MNEYIKQSIEARRAAIYDNCKVDDKMKKKIDEVFAEIEEFGAQYDDNGKFETDFAASPLNQKYIDLFTEIATSSQATTQKKAVGQAIVGGIVGWAASRVTDGAVRKVVPTRASIHQAKYDMARKIPGVGDALHLKNQVETVKHFGKLFGLGKKKSSDK